MVVEKKMSIRAACRELRIKPSTGKLIVKRFRTKGTYYEPKTQRKLSLQTKAQLSTPSEEEEEPAHQTMDFTNEIVQPAETSPQHQLLWFIPTLVGWEGYQTSNLWQSWLPHFVWLLYSIEHQIFKTFFNYVKFLWFEVLCALMLLVLLQKWVISLRLRSETCPSRLFRTISTR